MTEYYKVIEDYLTRWPTESKFIKAHENYRVEGTADTSWVLGKDYMEGDVIFTIAILGYIFFKQTLNWQAILGLFFIVIGVILVNSYTGKLS